MKTGICICVPTADRAEMLQDVLAYELDSYRDFGMDVAIYDTSKDDRTEETVKGFLAHGYKNLKYQRVSEDRCLDYKLIDILRHDMDLRAYEYIWLMNDSLSVLPEALPIIIEQIGIGRFDMIRLPFEGKGAKEDRISCEPNDWFRHASQGMAHMAATIMKSSLLDGDIDWEALREKYVGSADLNSPEHGFFFMVGFYLERILGLDSFCGLHMGNYVKWRRESPFKKNNSYWKDMIFEVWLRSYCETIFKLPSCYTCKEEVIRKSDNIIFNRFEEASLIALRIQGLLSAAVAEKYRMYWPLVSTVPMERICGIAMMPIAELKEKYGENFGDMDCWQDNLEKILEAAGQEPIIVYGAGKYGGCAVEYLLKSGFKSRLAGVAVSKAGENVRQLYGVTIHEIESYCGIRETALVIIAILPDAARGLREILQGKGFKNVRELFWIGGEHQ